MKTLLTLLITCSFVFCVTADVVEIGPVQDAYICCCKSDYSSVISSIGFWPQVDEWYIVDITEFLVAWFTGNEDNFGIYCHSQNTTGTYVPGFYSSNYSISNLRPKLIVTYDELQLSANTWASIKHYCDLLQ